MVLNATVKLKSATGERDVSVNEFFRGPGETAIEPHELLVSITAEDAAPVQRRCVHQARRTQDAGNLHGERCRAAAFGIAGRAHCECCRIALGAVAPHAGQGVCGEEFLAGKAPSDELFQEAGGEIGVGFMQSHHRSPRHHGLSVHDDRGADQAGAQTGTGACQNMAALTQAAEILGRDIR